MDFPIINQPFPFIDGFSHYKPTIINQPFPFIDGFSHYKPTIINQPFPFIDGFSHYKPTIINQPFPFIDGFSHYKPTISIGEPRWPTSLGPPIFLNEKLHVDQPPEVLDPSPVQALAKPPGWLP